MNGHPTLLELLEHGEREDTRAHLEACPACRARVLMLEMCPPDLLPGLTEARRAFADTRRLASMSIGHTWGTDPLREPFEAPPDLEIGRVVERYVVRDRIGAGAMGALYRVEHTQLGSRHALKVLHRTSDAVRGRLIREGRAQSRLQHANVVPVTDVVDIDGAPGLIMEFVDGPSLSVWLREHGPPTLATATRLGEQIIRAVAAAHDAGIVHRDLKPSNVLIARTDEGPAAKVCDFGLALSSEDEEGRTGPLGTPGYMAPEQIHDASAVDARSDIFSLGAVLYELATGERAFTAPDLLGLWACIRAGEYTPPQDVRPDLPESMLDAIDIALQVDPDARFDDCRELLATWRGGRPLTEEVPRPMWPAGAEPPSRPPVKAPSSRALWLVAALGAAAVVVAVGFGMRGLSTEPVAAPPPATDRADRRLTAIPAEVQIMAMALADDDTQLLYSDGRGLWHHALDTDVTRLVAPGGPYHALDWLPSPSSEALVSGWFDGTRGTFRVDIETGTFDPISDATPGLIRVAPSGDAVAMVRDDGVWTLGIDGSDEHRILEHSSGQYSSAMAWSPDGRFLALVVQGGSSGTPAFGAST